MSELQRSLQPVAASELPGLPQTVQNATRVLAAAAAVVAPAVFVLHAALGDWLLDRVLYMLLAAEPLLWAGFGLTFTKFAKRYPELLLWWTATLADAYLALAGLQSPTGASPYALLALTAPVALAVFVPWKPSSCLALGASNAAIALAAGWALPEGASLPAAFALPMAALYASLGAVAAQSQRMLRADLQRIARQVRRDAQSGRPEAPKAEAPKLEAARQETAKQETAKPETAKSGQAAKTVLPAKPEAPVKAEPPVTPVGGRVAPPRTPAKQSLGFPPPPPTLHVHVTLPEGAAPPTLHGRVLLADRAGAERAQLEESLRSAGLHVELVDNGRDAHARAMSATLSGTPYDVVVLAADLTELSGYAAASALRADGYDGPIVALTAEESDREACFSAGCDDFATKPIERGPLLALLGRFLEKPYRPKH